MHRCLLIDEIIAIITRQTRRLHADSDLLHLALACRAFYEPAMDTLWRDTWMVLGKLLLCLPEDAHATVRSVTFEDGEQRDEFTVRIVRPLVQSDWGRVMHHARRVRHLNLGATPSGTWFKGKIIHVPMPTLIEVQRYCPSSPLLRNLRNLCLHDDHSPFLPLFLHPGLTTLSLHGALIEDASTREILKQLRVCAPRLEKLIIEAAEELSSEPDSREREHGVQEQVALLSRCTKLRELWTKIPLTNVTFIHLAGLSSLQDAALRIETSPDARNLSLQASPSLRGLHTLRLTGRVEDLSKLLAMYSFPRLSSIRLTLVLDTDEVDFDTPPNHTPNVSAYGLDRLSMAICGKRTLEKVSIYVQNTWQEQEDTLTPVLYARQLVAGEAFRALEGLRNLKHLSVGEIPVYLQPEDITSMARAWPQLEHLLFTRASPDIVFPVEITIEDLYPLAEHCPNLEFLAIPVAGSGNTSVPFDGVIPERLVQRPLASIDLRHSDIQSGPDCERIARFLSMVYPNTGFTLWPENKEVVHEVIDLLWELRGY